MPDGAFKNQGTLSLMHMPLHPALTFPRLFHNQKNRSMRQREYSLFLVYFTIREIGQWSRESISGVQKTIHGQENATGFVFLYIDKLLIVLKVK